MFARYCVHLARAFETRRLEKLSVGWEDNINIDLRAIRCDAVDYRDYEVAGTF